MRRNRAFCSDFVLERLEMRLSPAAISLSGAAVSFVSPDDPLPPPEPPPPPVDPQTPGRPSRRPDR